MPIGTTPTPTPAAAPSPRSTLPPPQTFDILPPLHALLSRLLLPHPHQQPAEISTPSSDTPIYLSPKDVATAASSVGAKIQKARAAVRELPGVEMGVKELEGIIKELEEEMERLEGVRRAVARAVREVRVGGGGEGEEEENMGGQEGGKGDRGQSMEE